jgi:uncharacterized repeat protein (TIGR03806 family)
LLASVAGLSASAGADGPPVSVPGAAWSKPYLNMPQTRDGTLPQTLSQVGAFQNVKDLTPREGLVAYDINAPFWSDGAQKQRWMALPTGQHIEFSAEREWTFPAGTVFVKHFALPVDEAHPKGPRTPVETRVLVRDADGGIYGACYRWRADGSDADLVTEPLTALVQVGRGTGARTQSWYFPGMEDCRVCHTPVSGLVLGVKTRQLNRPLGNSAENQLTLWARAGLFGQTPPDIHPQRLAKLAGADDQARSAEDRARSFLDVNCSNCHRPGGVAGNFDARYETPLARQNLLDGPVLIDLGIDRAKVISPHDPWRSLALVRIETSDRTRMPPLAHERIDAQGARVLREWIASLPGPTVLEPPKISPKGGEFHDRIRVVLSQPQKDAVIHYTLDGSLPVISSPVYREPIEIKEPVTLRARAYKEGAMRSIVVQETFIVND